MLRKPGAPCYGRLYILPIYKRTDMKRNIISLTLLALLLCNHGKTAAQTTPVEIDLSTVTDGEHGSYGADKTNIYMDKGGSFILKQSDPNTPTERYIQTYGKCTITLDGINIAVDRASYPAMKIAGETTFILSEGSVNRLKTSSPDASALAVESNLIIEGEGTLIVEAPYTSESFNGVGIKVSKTLTVNNGTILCDAAGDGILIYNYAPYYNGNLILNGGDITARGNNGIAAYSNTAESIALSGAAQVTAFGKSAALLNIPDSVTAKTIQYAFGYTPATDVTLTVKEGETTVRTFTVPVGDHAFAFSVPEGAVCTLWEGDKQLTSDTGETHFVAGGSYNLKKNIEIVHIDLTTVADGEYPGYSVTPEVVSLTGKDYGFVFDQSNASTSSNRRISIESDYDITLNGINIKVAEGNAVTVAGEKRVNFLLNENTVNRLEATTQGAGLALEGNASVNGKGMLVINAPYRSETVKGEGIIVKDTLSINSGTIVCTSGGNGVHILNETAGRLIINNGSLVLTGENGIVASSDAHESITRLANEAHIVMYAQKATTLHIPDSITAKMMRFAYAETPETTTLVTVNSGETVMDSLAIPAAHRYFAFSAPQNARYHLWQDDWLLADETGITNFITGGSYTGLEKKVIEVRIDLSTVTDGNHENYDVQPDYLSLNKRGIHYILSQSNDGTTTNRAIKVEANCNVTLGGVNITSSENTYNTFETGNKITANLFLEDETCNYLNNTSGGAGFSVRQGKVSIGGNGTLVLDSPVPSGTSGTGRGIMISGEFIINEGKVICTAAGDAISFSGLLTINDGNLLLTGMNGILTKDEKAVLTIKDDTEMTIYARSGLIVGTQNPVAGRMMQFAFATSPKEETAIDVCNDETPISTLTVPAKMKYFAFTSPLEATYTLWENNLQLIDGAGEGNFITGGSYTGLKPAPSGIFTLESCTERIVNLYTTDGKFVRTVRINADRNILDELPSGIYVAEGEKIVK